MDKKKEILQTLKDLEADVEDAQKVFDEAFYDLDKANKWLEKAKVMYAESIIKLNKFKKEHKIQS